MTEGELKGSTCQADLLPEVCKALGNWAGLLKAEFVNDRHSLSIMPSTGVPAFEVLKLGVFVELSHARSSTPSTGVFSAVGRMSD